MERPRKLGQIANWINQNLSSHVYEAIIVKGFCNTDRKLAGTRLRIPGKGREGNKIIIKKDGVIIKEHNSAETYRTNREVENWLEYELKKIG